MEELKLIMDDVMKNREKIDMAMDRTEILRQVGNETIHRYSVLVDKHNKLCKATKGLCFVCLGLDILLLVTTIDISKMKREIKELKEEKEG